MSSRPLLADALEYHHMGLAVLPLERRSKTPARAWKRWTHQTQTEQVVRSLFEDHDGNIGIIGGAVSGNLVVLDFDDRSAFDEAYAFAGFAALVDATFGVETSR